MRDPLSGPGIGAGTLGVRITVRPIAGAQGALHYRAALQSAASSFQVRLVGLKKDTATFMVDTADRWKVVESILSLPGYHVANLQQDGDGIGVVIDSAPLLLQTEPVAGPGPSTLSVSSALVTPAKAPPKQAVDHNAPAERAAVPLPIDIPATIPAPISKTAPWTPSSPDFIYHGPSSTTETEPRDPKAIGLNIAWGCGLVFLYGIGAWFLQIKLPPYLPGTLPGVDTYAHLFKLWFVYQNLASGSGIAQWMPWWWCGYAYLQYAAPMQMFLMIPFYAIGQSLEITYALYMGACSITGAVGVYLVGRRWYQRIPAIIAGALYMFGPWAIRFTYGQGNLPHAAVMAISPFLLLAIVHHLERPTRISTLAIAGLVCVDILTHHMVALLFFVCAGLFTIGYSVWQNVDAGTFFSLVIAAMLGGAIGAIFLLPAVLPADYPDVPSLRSEWVTSMTINQLVPLLPMTLLGALTVLIRRDAFGVGLLAAAGIALALSLGNNAFYYQYIPGASLVIPRRFLSHADMFVALLAGYWIAFVLRRWPRWIRLPAIVIPVGLALFLAWPYIQLVKPQTYYANLQPLFRSLAQEQNDGRYVGGSTYYDSQYLPAAMGGKPVAISVSAEGSPLQYENFNQNYARRTTGYAYDGHLWALWNVRYVQPYFREEVAYLQSIGFDWFDPGKTIMANPRPSTYVMHQDRSTLVLGRGAVPMASMFPWVAEGRFQRLAEYDQPYLSQFKNIWLYDFRYGQEDREEGEEMLRRLLRQGTNLMIDTAFLDDGMPFGIPTRDIDVRGAPRLRLTDEGRALLGDIDLDVQPFSTGFDTWRAKIPINPDGALVESNLDGLWRPVIGYTVIEGQRVYITGLNLVAHAQGRGDHAVIGLLERLLELGAPNKKVFPEPLAISEQRWLPDRFEFRYQSLEDVPAIISITWSPHWRATVDGQPWRIYEYERMSEMFLPAGEHQVVWTYGFTPVQYWSGLLSLLAILLLAVQLTVGWRVVTAFSRYRLSVISDWLRGIGQEGQELLR